MKKTILSALCTLIMVPLFAGTVWDGTIATSLPTNAGTAEDPYQITTGAQLAYVAQVCNSGAASTSTENYKNQYFKLMNDIDLNNNEWTPIGWHATTTNRSVFCGHFDGNGYTISNLKISTLKKIASGGTVNTQMYGFFGAVLGGSIKNLTVSGAITNLATANIWIAGITGRASGTVIQKCINKVNITDETTSSRTTANTIGGIVGYSDGATAISQCANHGAFSVKMIGTGTTTYNRYVGAIIAQGGTSVTVADCYNSGAITMYGKKTAGTWNLYVGSIAGDCKSVNNCYNRGAISLPDTTKTSMNTSNFGTIIGNNARTVTASYYLENSIAQIPTAQGLVKTDAEMKDAAFTTLLGSNFKQGDEQYPVLSFEPLEPKDPWDGTIASKLPDNAGTEDDPYLITTSAQLALVAKNVDEGTNYSGVYFKLANDLDFNNQEWTPIGWHVANDNKAWFEGNFDGDGHTINNMKISKTHYIHYAASGTSCTFYGLFGAVANGTIQNVTVNGSISGIASTSQLGGIIGRAQSETVYRCVSHVAINASTSNNTQGLNYAGGIVCNVTTAATISECVNYGAITATLTTTGSSERIVGGILSNGITGSITDCYNVGAITISGTSSSLPLTVGGLAGTYKEITNSYNRAALSVTATVATLNYGPLVGKVNTTPKVTNSYYLATCATGTTSNQEGVSKTEVEMKDAAFTTLLGNKFKQGDEDYPVLRYEKAEPREPWDGSIASKLPDNAGTEADPYMITTSGQLALIAKNVDEGTTYNGKYFKLANDLDLNNQEWTPIGWHVNNTNKAWFEGNFDGDGHTINNLKIAKTHYVHYAAAGNNISFYGLFGAISTGVIQNLTVNGAVSPVLNAAAVSGIVGRATNCTILKCCNMVNINAKTNNKNGISSTGGVVGGTVDDALIQECVNRGTITAAMTTDADAAIERFVGGIVGSGTSARVYSCYNAGAITISGSSNNLNLYVGPIAGGYYRVNSSYNYASVNVTATVNSKMVGTIVGKVNSSPRMTNDYYMEGAVVDPTRTDATSKTEDEMKSLQMIKLLNGIDVRFAVDGSSINNGYPILTWEDETSVSDIALDEADDNSTLLTSMDGQVVNATLTRTLSSSYYNTLCLPFMMSPDLVNATFGDDCELLELTSATLENSAVILDFAEPTNKRLKAGVPYLIKPTTDLSELVINQVTIDNALKPVEMELISFNGIFNPTALTAMDKNQLFLGVNNTLYMPSDDSQMKGMRAYFVLTDKAPAGVSARMRVGKTIVTSLDEVGVNDQLVKMIKDGKIVILRNGDAYNVLGQTIQ